MNRIYNNATTKEQRRNLRKNQTDSERKLWSILRTKRMGTCKFFRQYSVGPYILDFYCPAQRMAIEVDGGQHAEDIHQQHDAQRTSYLTQQDILVLRFWNNEVLQNLEGVWLKIKETLDRRFVTPPTSPYPKGRFLKIKNRPAAIVG